MNKTKVIRVLQENTISVFLLKHVSYGLFAIICEFY